jgi:GDP/UDP-N,N'-diacetylbacillosamine 2-epimerase (hydrolysing)
MKKKVLAITGIRSEYDILFPVIDLINKSNDFDLSLVVSSAHLSDWHGNTLLRIEEDGFKIVDKIDSLLMTNRETQRIKGIGLLTYALAQTVEREKPDFLFVVGDREESISTALVGNYMNILTAHLGGGDPVWGNADDPIRMATSKLAHIHFTTCKAYSENLIKLSEDPFRIFFCGNPALTNIRDTEIISLSSLSEYLNFDITNGKYIVLIKHPLSSEKESAFYQMNSTLEALEKFCDETGYKVVASFPNTDPGSYDIVKAINNIINKKFITFNKTLPRIQFVNLLRNARALVGNSSLGLLEAPFYKLPVVNIGNRQQGRLNAGNVNFVNYEINNIVNALKNACFNEEYRNKIYLIDSPFGNGDAPERIIEALRGINPSDKRWLIKSNLC